MARTLVRAYLGYPGSGKTYSMATMAEEWRAVNPERPIFSTFELRLPNVYSVDPPGDDWGPVVKLVDCEHGLLLLDEAALIYDSRASMRIPLELMQKVTQIRKYGLELWWSTQFLEYVDKRLRLLTFESYHMENLAWLRLPWFWAGIHIGLKGRLAGYRLIRRSGGRDRLYDCMKVISSAGFLTAHRA